MKQLALVLGLVVVGCNRPSSPICIGGAEFTQGACKSKRVERHSIPFPAGVTTTVTQAFYGGYSHHARDAFSVDFTCQVGDPIVASRDGYVVFSKEDSAVNCADPSCESEANVVEIDHGDGTVSEYAHLERLGVLVEEGDSVCRGDLIGLCGNTGFSLGPHLHFTVRDMTRQAIPVQFDELRRTSTYGLVAPDTSYVSRNRKQSRCRPTEPSSLGKDAFAHQGIVLDQRLSTEIQLGSKMRLSGTYAGDYEFVAVLARNAGDEEILGSCVPVRDGRFDANFDWPNERFKAGRAVLMIAGSGAQCAGPVYGWSWAYPIRLVAR